jgi:putative oxidoreductase
MAQFVFTEEHSAGPVARIALAVVMIPHGLQKSVGMFGGKGLIESLDSFVLHGIPYALGVLVIAGETLGALALLIGLFGRFMAAWIAAILIVAIIKVHLVFGFFMNWGGMKEGEGIEFHLLAIALALIVIITGSGSLSIDRWLTRRYWG